LGVIIAIEFMAVGKKKSDTSIMEVALGLLAVAAIFTLFRGDSGKVLTNQGRNYMDDDEKMAELEEKLEQMRMQSESNNNSIDVML
jgi:hypothetical protein